MIDAQTVLRRAQNTCVQPLCGGSVILRTDTGQLYSTNETGDSFLSHVNGQRAITDIAHLMKDEFDIESAILFSDILALAEELCAEGILECAQ